MHKTAYLKTECTHPLLLGTAGAHIMPHKPILYLLGLCAASLALLAICHFGERLPGATPLLIQHELASRDGLLRRTLRARGSFTSQPPYILQDMAYGILLDAGSGSTKPGIW
eukprot:scaffold103758_cov38-Prasinocladus_malaysianus.AAC.1